MHRASMRSLLRIAATSAVLSAAMAADIYRCADAEGNVVFTDVHCSNGELLPTPQTARPANSPTGLSAAEETALATLERRLEAQTEVRDRKRRRARGEAERRRSAQRQACSRATAALQQIAREKRRGYRLRDARRLDAREQEALATVQASCRRR